MPAIPGQKVWSTPIRRRQANQRSDCAAPAEPNRLGSSAWRAALVLVDARRPSRRLRNHGHLICALRLACPTDAAVKTASEMNLDFADFRHGPVCPDAVDGSMTFSRFANSACERGLSIGASLPPGGLKESQDYWHFENLCFCMLRAATFPGSGCVAHGTAVRSRILRIDTFFQTA